MTVNKNWQRIKFECEKCGQESWFECDLNTLVLTTDADWFLCDECNPCEDD